MNLDYSRPLQWTMIVAAVAAFCLALPGPTSACTTAVISGGATADGRPILWKNRDAADLHNQLVACNDGRYRYVGVVNQGDTAGLQIWTGINTQGFAIMNAASYSLEEGDTVAEGNFMKLALQTCATVAEFQALLDKTSPGRDISANFGVIDAQGGAAFFETGKKTYTRYDATDPKAAPHGYIVRTNYSESANRDKGSGFLRAERANALVEALLGAGPLTVQRLLVGVCRDIGNARLGDPLGARRPDDPAWAYTRDSINRFETSSAALFAGVKPGEDPALATAWIVLGQPVTGVAIPVWAAAGEVPAEVAAGKDPAPLTAMFDRIRDFLYPDRSGDLKWYINIERLGDAKNGIPTALAAQEADNFTKAGAALEKWRRNPPAPADMAGLQRELARSTLEAMKALAAKLGI
ncbi:MAG TPA: carcinine hydrolase/isopenicillin-N N-acyltransferase family protein [Thermoanaerobaculaceae bacterium]|nr:carcinine hydrolase/isopenicillin-N N-acyltransferase family protein [Thermoanaerobaculaceae bacterium]